MSLLLKRPQHALLPWRVIFVITFLFVLFFSAIVSYVNSAIALVTENPVEKYLNGLSVLMSLLFTVLMVGLWAVGATIRDQRLLRAQIRK